MYSNCRMEGVVTADGIAPTAIEHYCTAPTKKWPYPGQDLPVLVDRSDPRRLKIAWDDISTGRDRGRQAAQAMAAAMTITGAPGRAAPGTPGGGTTPEQAAAALSGQSGLQRATAVVLAAHEVAVPAGMAGGGPAGVVDITLDITPPDGNAYTAVTRIAFSTPQRRAKVTGTGTTLPVLIDPADHSRVVIDANNIDLS
jgi:hypothetical protein